MERLLPSRQLQRVTQAAQALLHQGGSRVGLLLLVWALVLLLVLVLVLVLMMLML
jgi:hypothetical protein